MRRTATRIHSLKVCSPTASKLPWGIAQFSTKPKQLLESNVEPQSPDYELASVSSYEPELEPEEEAPKPWQHLVGYPSRAKWITSTPPPPALVETLTRIVEQHTSSHHKRDSKQSWHRTMERIIQAQGVLASNREDSRKLHSRKHGGYGGGGGSGGGIGVESEPIPYTPQQTVVGLKHRLIPNYSVTVRVLEEVQSLLGHHNNHTSNNNNPVRRVLDMGMGCGSASAAAWNVFEDVEWIHGIDPSRSQRDAAQLVLEELQLSAQTNDNEAPRRHKHKRTRVTTSSTLSHVQTESTDDSGLAFDLALFAYTASELPTTNASLAAAAMLWEKLGENGLLVMIEPGTPDGFQNVRAVRQMLLECCPPNVNGNGGVDVEDSDPEAYGAFVVAPCTHNGTCPMDRDKTNETHSPKQPHTKRSRSSYDSEHPYTEHDNYQDVTAQPLNTKNNSSFGSNKTKTNVRHYEEFHAFSESYCSFVQNLPFLNGDTQSTEKFSYVVLQKRSLQGDSLLKSTSDSDTSTENPKQTYTDWQDINIVELLAQSLNLSSTPKHKHKHKHSYNNQNIMQKRKKEYRQLLASQTLQARATAIQEEFLDSNEDDLGLELVSGRNTQHWGRLVRAPLKKKKHVILDYCTSCASSCGGGKGGTSGQEEGRIIRHTIGKASHGEAAGPGMYHAARRARWGGLWPDVVK